MCFFPNNGLSLCSGFVVFAQISGLVVFAPCAIKVRPRVRPNWDDGLNPSFAQFAVCGWGRLCFIGVKCFLTFKLIGWLMRPKVSCSLWDWYADTWSQIIQMIGIKCYLPFEVDGVIDEAECSTDFCWFPCLHCRERFPCNNNNNGWGFIFGLFTIGR